MSDGINDATGERSVAKTPKRRGDGTEDDPSSSGIEGVGPRFKKGSEDLEQLEGLERQQERSRKARRKLKQADTGQDPDPHLVYPLIEKSDKSRRRVKNRFQRVKDPEDAINEFGS